MDLWIAAGALAGLLLGGAAGWFFTRRSIRKDLQASREEAATIRSRARSSADEEHRKILLAAREEAQALRSESDRRLFPSREQLTRTDPKERRDTDACA